MRHLANFEIFECRECRLFVNEKVTESDVNNVNTSSLEHSSRSFMVSRPPDEAWLTLKSVGNKTVKPDELARAVLRWAMEGERDPARLHDEALKGMLPATTWREAN
jgi:poly(3-hydroxyalkanoate) synthetase